MNEQRLSSLRISLKFQRDHLTNMSSSSMITPILLLRANIDLISCLIAIPLNISFLKKILRQKTKNFFLINTTLNLIGSCLVLIFSISLTLYYSISLQIKYDLCRLNGYLINSFFHGIIYSYVLLNMNTFYAKTCRLSKCSQIMQICFQWILAFVLSYLSHEYEFQFKGRFCFFRTKFSLIQNFSTSLILPIVVNILLNSLIYFYIQQRRTSNPNRINYQQTTSLYQQISRRLYQRQNQKYLQLMRQTLIILFVGCLVWGSFHLLSLIDHNKIVPDDVYLLVLSFPSICLLIQTLLIQSWHKLTKKSLRTTKNLRTFSSTTTVRFSQSINPNHVDLF